MEVMCHKLEEFRQETIKVCRNLLMFLVMWVMDIMVIHTNLMAQHIMHPSAISFQRTGKLTFLKGVTNKVKNITAHNPHHRNTRSLQI